MECVSRCWWVPWEQQTPIRSCFAQLLARIGGRGEQLCSRFQQSISYYLIMIFSLQSNNLSTVRLLLCLPVAWIQLRTDEGDDSLERGADCCGLNTTGSTVTYVQPTKQMFCPRSTSVFLALAPCFAKMAYDLQHDHTTCPTKSKETTTR